MLFSICYNTTTKSPTPSHPCPGSMSECPTVSVVSAAAALIRMAVIYSRQIDTSCQDGRKKKKGKRRETNVNKWRRSSNIVSPQTSRKWIQSAEVACCLRRRLSFFRSTFAHMSSPLSKDRKNADTYEPPHSLPCPLVWCIREGENDGQKRILMVATDGEMGRVYYT